MHHKPYRGVLLLVEQNLRVHHLGVAIDGVARVAILTPGSYASPGGAITSTPGTTVLFRATPVFTPFAVVGDTAGFLL